MQRTSALIAHPTSLPGPHGMGDLGPEAHRFIDVLASAKVGTWQILPLCPPGRGWSPYASPSSLGLNPLLVSLEKLVDCGLLGGTALSGAPGLTGHRIDFDAVHAWKMPRLRMAAEEFIREADEAELKGYRDFCARQGAWLVDHADFTLACQIHGHGNWTRWPSGLRDRVPDALREFRSQHALEREIEKVLQHLAHEQWNALRERAGAEGISILGDVGYYVAHESADVWAHRHLFELGPEGELLGQGGAPPDAYAERGQCWETPLHRWEAHREDRFAWWRRRFRMASLQGGRVRLDHFNGVIRYWAIPQGARDATEGTWRPGPGAPLLKALQETLPAGALIAEDLGTETPGGDELRAEWDIPGMRVLQFGVGPEAALIHHPEHVTRDVGYYTSTHDSPPLRQWLDELSPEGREEVRSLTGTGDAWSVLECAWHSSASLVGAQIQDVLGLGGVHRMNVPGTAAGNWAFSIPRDALMGEWIPRLADLNDATGRSA